MVDVADSLNCERTVGDEMVGAADSWPRQVDVPAEIQALVNECIKPSDAIHRGTGLSWAHTHTMKLMPMHDIHAPCQESRDTRSQKKVAAICESMGSGFDESTRLWQHGVDSAVIGLLVNTGDPPAKQLMLDGDKYYIVGVLTALLKVPWPLTFA
jgi:hypothetical protein